MSQEKLNGLPSLCIEKKLLDEININSVIDEECNRCLCIKKFMEIFYKMMPSTKFL
jgi:hypothetical protein